MWMQFLNVNIGDKMKKIRLLICIVMIFLTCSCSAEINVLFDSNFNIEEQVKIYTFKDVIYSQYNSEEEFLQYYKDYLNNRNIGDYKFRISETDDNLLAIIEKRYNGLTELEKVLFSKIDKNNMEYTLAINKDIQYLFVDPDGVASPEELIYKIELNIQFHNVVSDANSDSYNSVTNTYTWIIDEKNLDRNIEFTITNEKRYDIIIPYLLKKYIGYVILGTLLIGILIFVLVIINKAKRENEI